MVASKTIIWSSKNFDGEIEFRFDENSLLTGFDFCGNTSREQKIWMLSRMPGTLQELQELAKVKKSIVLTEQKNEVTFEMFWNRYGYKVDRKKTLNRWNRMSKSEKLLAYNHIPVYFRQIPGGVEKRYPSTYLNSELWND